MTPEAIVIAAEAASCKGCAREMKVRFGNEIKRGCTKGKAYGTRCKQYSQDTRKGADAQQGN
jgi:hypothetical protein